MTGSKDEKSEKSKNFETNQNICKSQEITEVQTKSDEELQSLIEKNADHEDFDEALNLCKEFILKNREDPMRYELYYTIVTKSILKYETYSKDLETKISEAYDIGELLLEKVTPDVYPKYKIRIDSMNERISEHASELRKIYRNEEISKAKKSSIYFLISAIILIFLMGCVLAYLHGIRGQ